jgi:DNA-binding transcriptional MerR regulator
MTDQRARPLASVGPLRTWSAKLVRHARRFCYGHRRDPRTERGGQGLSQGHAHARRHQGTGHAGSFRIYPATAIDRIAFIKRAQVLGFTLDEVRSLLNLEDGRNRRAIQSVTQARLGQIEEKLADLNRMRGVLSELLDRCRQAVPTRACPIIETLSGGG